MYMYVWMCAIARSRKSSIRKVYICMYVDICVCIMYTDMFIHIYNIHVYVCIYMSECAQARDLGNQVFERFIYVCT